MTMEVYSNAGSSTLNGDIDNAVTSLVVTSAATFPSGGNFRILIGSELMKVTGVSGTTFTVARAQEGTSAASHTSGTAVDGILTKASLDAIISDNALTGTYASLPTDPAKAGRIYRTTDSIYTFLNNGSSWLPFFGPWKSTLPVNSSFAWINQGTATVTNSGGVVRLQAASAGGPSAKIRKKTLANASNYTATIGFIPDCIAGPSASANVNFILILRNSGSGKFVFVGTNTLGAGAGSDTFNAIQAGSYTDATTYNATDYFTFQLAPCNWFRFRDDGANRYAECSFDGLNWVTLYQTARTTFMTPDEVGFAVVNIASAITQGMTVFSFEET